MPVPLVCAFTESSLRVQLKDARLTSGTGSLMLQDTPWRCIFETTECLEKVGLGLKADATVSSDAAARKLDNDTFMVEASISSGFIIYDVSVPLS